MSIFKENLFEELISCLKDKYELNNTETFKSFIRKLKPHLYEFHNSIRGRGKLLINYDKKETQIIYALKYFHAYWNQIYTALKIINKKNKAFFSKDLNIGLLACGPAPEIIGLTRFVETMNLESNIYVDLIDKNTNWNFARNLFLFSQNKNLKMQDIGININAAFEHDFQNYSIDNPEKYDLVSMQNCCNEIFINEHEEINEKIYENLDSIMSNLRVNGYFILSDRNISDNEYFYDFLENTYFNIPEFEINYNSTQNYFAKGESPLPEILSYGNFYVSSTHANGIKAMNKNSYRLLIVKKLSKPIPRYQWILDELEKVSKFSIEKIKKINLDKIRSDFFKIEEINSDFPDIDHIKKLRNVNLANGEFINNNLPVTGEEILTEYYVSEILRIRGESYKYFFCRDERLYSKYSYEEQHLLEIELKRILGLVDC